MEYTVEQCEKEKKNKERKMLVRLAVAAIVVLLLVLGLSLAWFVNQNNIETLLEVRPPAEIAIRGPHGEALTELDMSYTDADKSGDKVTIRRVISISSETEKHKLEIMHTTNLKGLTFKIYPATENASTGGDTVKDGKYSYTYDKSNPLKGAYINQKNEAAEYKYASGSYHSRNFDSYSNVQTHAEPIYWLADEEQIGIERDQNTTTVKDKYLNYYVVEISWTETTKETDLFYLLAKNV